MRTRVLRKLESRRVLIHDLQRGYQWWKSRSDRRSRVAIGILGELIIGIKWVFVVLIT